MYKEKMECPFTLARSERLAPSILPQARLSEKLGIACVASDSKLGLLIQPAAIITSKPITSITVRIAAIVMDS